MTRLLHTSDWHLGHALYDGGARYEEHDRFLNWLREVIREECVDVLVIAGDVFDSANPPHRALAQYYNFLTDIRRTGCRQVIVVGGNHDSPGTLEAPRQILRHLDVHVVGQPTENPADQVLPITDADGRLAAVVCAVPFLRDRDLRRATAGQSYEEIEAQLRAGLVHYYERVAAAATSYRQQGCAVLATGHLYAAGCQPCESEKDIHLGNLGQVSAASFPALFDYVALGHLHRPQVVGGQERVQYAGSPLPLSFSEHRDGKVVKVVELRGGAVHDCRSLPVPVARRLLCWEGTLEEVTARARAHRRLGAELPAWADVTVHLNEYRPQVAAELRTLTDPAALEVLRVRTTYPHSEAPAVPPAVSLADLSPEEVFRRKCTEDHVDLDQQPELLQSFRQLMAELHERDG